MCIRTEGATDILNIWEKAVSFQGYTGTLACSIMGGCLS